MEKKIKFFWMYTIILFTVAFVLILFSALSAGQHQDLRQDIYMGSKNTLDALTQENNQYKTTIEALESSVASLSQEVETLRGKENEYKQNVEWVLIAKDLCDAEDYSSANDVLMEVNSELLEGTVAEIYNQVKITIENNI